MLLNVIYIYIMYNNTFIRYYSYLLSYYREKNVEKEISAQYLKMIRIN
jgi:hypothetical protein